MTPFIGVSQIADRVKGQIKQAAEKELCVVITGEGGVGKEVVVQNLYHSSRRIGAPFIKVDFSTSSDTLLEHQFFSILQDGFDKIKKRKPVMLEIAYDGVLFFNEISEMPFTFQVKLLHALQNYKLNPIDSEQKDSRKLWVIATTSNELEGKVKSGDFNKDLYSKLNPLNIFIPPLRRRPVDIPAIVDYYIERYTPQFKYKQVLKPGISERWELMAYHWPENVREVQKVVRKFLMTGDWNKIIEELSRS